MPFLPACLRHSRRQPSMMPCSPSLNGGLITPFSVTIAEMSPDGVTSNAGLSTLTPSGAMRSLYHFSVTSSGALEGLGKGAHSLVISLCRYAAVILPAALLLCRLLGPEGVWHAFWITEVLTAGAAFWVYRRASA